MLNSVGSVISGGRLTDLKGGIMTLSARKPIGRGIASGREAEWKRGRRAKVIDSAMTITFRGVGLEEGREWM